MKMIAAVPFEVNKGGEIFNSGDSGYHQINKSLQELGMMTANGRPGMIGLDAISSCIAHVIKLHNDMKLSDLEERYAEEQWRKVITIFALSKYRAYDIQIDSIQEKQCNKLVWYLFGRKLTAETGIENKICMLQFEGKDIAFFDRKGFLLPVAEMPPEVEENMGADCIHDLQGYERDVLLTYLEYLAEKKMDYQQYILSYIRDLKKAGAKRKKEEEYKASFINNEILKNIFGNSEEGKSFCQIPELAEELPCVFHSRMVIAPAQSRNRRISGFGEENTITFQVTFENNPYSFSGFLPLSKEMADYLETTKNTKLDSVSIDEAMFVKEQRLCLTLSFVVGRERIYLKKWYRKDNISLSDSVPLLTLFPYVNLPEKYWKRYYLVMMRGVNQDLNDIEFLKDLERISGADIDMADPSVKRSTEKDNGRTEWYYARKEKLPSFVKLCISDFTKKDAARNTEKQTNYIGCVCAGKPKIGQEVHNKTFRWALDMGTRNTIVGYKNQDMANPSHILSREELYCTLMIDSASGIMDKEFAQECYAPEREINGKFPTMSRIYREGKGDNEINCYEQGCALFPNMELINKFMAQGGALEEDLIITDVKFGNDDHTHALALQIFLFNMLWLGCLECVLCGASKIQVLVSYPRSDIREKIEKIWNMVSDKMQYVSEVEIEGISYCMEAEANARYLQKTMKSRYDERITKTSTFGICDIGDGTSDFNLYLGTSVDDKLPKRIQFSMRYAGGDILVNTIMEYFKGKSADFRNLWKIPANDNEVEANGIYRTAVELIEEYAHLEELERNIGEEGYSLRENKRNIILMLIENVGLKERLTLNPKTEYKDFTVILLFKYWNLFQVYGNMLEVFSSKAFSFKLFLYGGGKQAIKDATGEDLDKFHETPFGEDIIKILSTKAGVPCESFSINLGGKYEKKEVVDGMLEVEKKQDSLKNAAYDSRSLIDDYYVQECGGVLSDIKFDQSKMEHLLEGYEAYVCGVKGKKYFTLSSKEEIENVYDALSIGNANDNLTERQSKNRSIFLKSAQSLWDEVSGDPDNPRCLLEVLFYVKISNYLLMKNI